MGEVRVVGLQAEAMGGRVAPLRVKGAALVVRLLVEAGSWVLQLDVWVVLSQRVAVLGVGVP